MLKAVGYSLLASVNILTREPFLQRGTYVELTAGSLLVSWSDPANQLLSPEIRGVHYCTVWAPTWAYWWMTEGAFV